jgi:membrane-associated phospholipid phosphatase
MGTPGKKTKALWLGLAIALSVSCIDRPAQADDVEPQPSDGGSPYRLRLAYDFAFLALGAAGSMTGIIGYAPTTCPAPCVPPHNQLGIDDSWVGTRSAGAMTAANILLGVTLAAPVIADAVDSRFHGFAEDMVVMVESLALSSALTQVMKSAAGRRAPLVYSPNATSSDLASADSSRSFPSGHTAAGVSVATAYAVTFWKRHPESPWRLVVLLGGEALALTTGILTIAAGWHYPTDVAAGALIGSGVGVAIPFLHSDW